MITGVFFLIGYVMGAGQVLLILRLNRKQDEEI
jgi:hypothetical protein